MDNILIVTRHAGLVEYLARKGIVGEVIAHATPDNVRGRDVFGVLPSHLASLANSFTEVPLVSLPQALRGKELTLENMIEFAGPMVTYQTRVTRVWDE